MQAPRNPAPAHTVCRIVASFALLSMLLACGYKGPLYLPPPPAPDASLTTPPAPASLPAPAATPVAPNAVPAK
ncbi:lipoprotein [Alcaligenaceae bacterium]|nr:lipoprotein [Alcaligenaceae bacterium]